MLHVIDMSETPFLESYTFCLDAKRFAVVRIEGCLTSSL